MPTDDLRQRIAARWNEWLATTDHRYHCAAASEGLYCCAEAPDPTVAAPLEGPDWMRKQAHQAKLLDMVLAEVDEALADEHSRGLHDGLG